MTPVVWLKDDQLAWLADLKAKGYDIPPGENEVFRPKANVPGAAERGPTFAPARFSAEDSNTAFLTNEVIKHISVRRDQPWFAHISYLSPHPRTRLGNTHGWPTTSAIRRGPASPSASPVPTICRSLRAICVNYAPPTTA
jgi:hypothetical protein